MALPDVAYCRCDNLLSHLQNERLVEWLYGLCQVGPGAGLSSLQDLGAGGYIFGDPYVAADNGIVPYGDAPEDGAVAVYDDIVLEDGVAVDAFDGVTLFIKGEAPGSEGDTLIELYVGA